MFNASNQSACIFSCFNFEQVPLTEISTLKFNDRKRDVIKKRPNSFLSQDWKICCVKSFILVLQRNVGGSVDTKILLPLHLLEKSQ